MTKKQSSDKNHQVLARKYRPKNFAEFVGQEHITQPLINSLKTKRIHHAFLFSGTRGVGKTTIARILAKCLNCEQNDITSTPCGECDSCVEINQGQSMDLIEFDAASHTKVDDMREILENSQYLPSKSRYKIYLIDEVHMLSKSSFNALLKTLEEPPKHIKFLLATTNPQKLPITVLSRCLQFSLQKIPLAKIQTQLEKLLKLEKITFDTDALEQISKQGQGSMRDALSILDQAIVYGDGLVKLSSVQKMLGFVNQDRVIELAQYLVEDNAEQALALSQNLSKNGNNLMQVLQNLLDIFHQISILLLLGNSNSSSPLTKILTTKCSQIQIQLYYQITLDGIKNFDLAPNSLIAFEMTLLRLLAFNPNKIIKQEKKN